jgi:hypothetical protein
MLLKGVCRVASIEAQEEKKMKKENYYIPGNLHIHHIVDEDNLEIRAAVEKRYPDGVWMNDHEVFVAIKSVEDGLCGQWKTITKARYWELLECMFPKGWRKSEGHEIFRMSELYTSNIRDVQVRIGREYFTAMFRDTMSDDDIFESAHDYMNKLQGKAS